MLYIYNIMLDVYNITYKPFANIISVTEFSFGLSDREILELAKTKGRIVVTFDKDFSQIIFKEKIKTKGVILLRFVPKSPQQVAKRIQQVLAAKIAMENCVVAVKKSSVRVIPAK
jgi:predicted nuclease of predicted toxin-antitoxin system